MASNKLAQRQIIAEITPITGDVTGPNLSGYFAQVSGGEITAAVEKIYIGGQAFPEVLCAPSEVGDVTLTKHYDQDLRTIVKDLTLTVTLLISSQSVSTQRLFWSVFPNQKVMLHQEHQQPSR